MWRSARVRKWTRRFYRFVTVLCGGYLALLLLVRQLYPRWLYPAPQHDANAPAEGELLTLRASDGATVHATAFSLRDAAEVLVYFHGNGVVMGDVLWVAREFVRRGLGVVLCEYRGYGLSAGSAPGEAGLYADAESVLTALSQRGVGPERVALFGESLGTGVAAEMAARQRGSALILVTPYTSIPQVAARFVVGLPVRLLMRERFDTLAKAPKIATPTLVLHGTADEVIPYSFGVGVANALPHGLLVTVPGAHHNDIFLGRGFVYFDRVVEFVHRTLG